MKTYKLLLFTLFISLIVNPSFSQEKNKKSAVETALKGFKFRSVGPAFMAGRIADIAIDPKNENTWYVAVGSGGAWKTNNAGTTWSALTENMPFYSTGCITIDPNNNESIWLGTGENVGGRHVGIGHGIYHSSDGGKSWKNKGLKESEHLSKIIVHPNDPNTLWVASQGPLWSSGGERGLYKTIDGGKTWKNTLEIDEWTGVTDLLIDPRNPDILYCASWQRHRNVASYIGGGPGTTIYKSNDGGESWQKINKGLPSSNMGKIGLAISPMNPDVVYAAVETERRKGAVYRSANAGGSWKKMSETVSAGTGPHYYQELVASPHKFDKIYLMNVRVLVSENGGKTFSTMKESRKHSDNHAMVFKKNDPNYILVGTDGGIYETFDDTKNWKFVSNLPITQFYKLAVDDAEPFYNIYGGTQDNNTQGGPSRTLRRNGITNADWYVVLGGDGHQPATEPGNPAIVYAQSQEGYLNRIDRTTGEVVNIRPQEGINEPYERFNWDSPILVSQHNPSTIYFASQRVWKSENRGDSWKPISNDLTKNEERFALPIMGRVQSIDNAWDVYAMSTYNTITSLAESKIDPNIMYAGTDDGIVQYTKNGGQEWTKMTVDKLPKTPSSAFVNDIKADLFDPNKAYICLDNHKFGDYQPYLFKTEDGGKSWKNITEGLPEKTLIWRIVQDHVNPNLLFLGTEYGVYISLNQGEKWHKFSNGLPTIPVRDLTIQRRENDLVLATFGRSFYVLDDFSPIRKFSEESLNKEAVLFESRKALQYTPMIGGTSSDGASSFKRNNPKYGATISYYVKDGYKSLTSQRIKKEKSAGIEDDIMDKLKDAGYSFKSIKDAKISEIKSKTSLDEKTIKKVLKAIEKHEAKEDDIPFPGWEALDKEKNDDKPEIIIEIKDQQGEVVRQIIKPLKKGLNRVNWDLSTYNTTIVKASDKGKRSWRYGGAMYKEVDPGTYIVNIFKRHGTELTFLAGPGSIEVERIRSNVLENPLANQHDSYYKNLAMFTKEVRSYQHQFDKANNLVKTMKANVKFIKYNKAEITKEIYSLVETMNQLNRTFGGSATRREVGEKDYLTISDRLSSARGGWYPNTYGPTELHMNSFEMARELFLKMQPMADEYIQKADELVGRFEEAGGPTILK